MFWLKGLPPAEETIITAEGLCKDSGGGSEGSYAVITICVAMKVKG